MPKIPKARPKTGASRRAKPAGNGAKGNGRTKAADPTKAADGAKAAEPTKAADAAKPAARDGDGAKAATAAKPRKKPVRRAPKPGGNGGGRGRAGVDFSHRQVDAAGPAVEHATTVELSDVERGLLADLFAVVEEHDDAGRIDRDPLERAFVFACERHADQRRRSGEDFIHHPVGVA